jgi:WD40 repeat protein
MPEAPLPNPAPPNQESLDELCRLLRFAQGEFALIVVECNSTHQQQELVGQLRQQCPIPFDELTLAANTTTLFTTIRDAIGDPPPAALMVYGLEGTPDLEPLLMATNQIREEFRQFPFPLVLWVTEGGLKQLIRTAPDFYTWANAVTFQTPVEYFIDFLDEVIRDVWQQVCQSRENRFLSNAELGLIPGSLRCRELSTSLAVLAAQQVALSPEQSAALEFVQGRIADQNTPVARDHYERSLAQWQALVEGHGPESSPTWHETIGYVQFYLGLWWGNYAVRHQKEFAAACTQACDYCQAAVQTFEAANRPELAAKYINYWALALHRLERWDELATVATQALAWHTAQQDKFRAARARGFLAEVAIHNQDWLTAQTQAETALELIQPVADIAPPVSPNGDAPSSQVACDTVAFYAWVNSFHRSWYLFSLGKAQLGQGHIESALQTLEQARAVTQPEYDPRLFSDVLEQLRQGYYQQGNYLKAFETRRYKEAIESRFNFRAFVGAGRLQPKQQVTNPALPGAEASQDLIAASGRKPDVQRLVARLAQDEFVLTIIYGPSGVGKSSLLEAGVVPALKQQRFDNRRVVPVRLRRYGNWRAELLQAISASEGRVSPGDSNSPQGWGAGGAAQIPAPEATPSHPEDHPTPSPVAPPPEPPAQVEPLLAALRQQTQRNRVMVLIFDQFEEFFFACDQTTDRRCFYHFLRDCLTMPFVKVVLSLREDYIHYLLEWGRLTTLDMVDDNILDKKWLYYLGNFSPADAQTVIHDLTALTPYSPEPELVQQVVQDLAGKTGEVRPIELQIVGAQLQAGHLTTLQQYRHQSEAKDVLVQQYLRDVVQECGPEANQQLADVLLYLLTDEKGTRPLKTRADLAEDLQTLTHHTEVNETAFDLVLQILTQSGLVQQLPASPADQYQLVHDYLAAFIRSTQQPLMAQLEQERQKRQAAEKQRAEEQQKRLAAERKQLRQTQLAAVGLGALAIFAAGAGGFAWRQWQKAARGEVNAKFLAESLAMEAYLESGLEQQAVTQAVKTGQALQSEAAHYLEPANRFRAISSIRDVLYEVKEQERLIGHSNWVYSVAFSPDGETIATASADQTVKLWNRQGEELQTLQGHSSWVYSVAFSPDGQTLATASADPTVKLWNLRGEELQTLQGHNDAVLSVAFSPNGQTLATASSDQTVKLWNRLGEELQTLQGHNDAVLSVAFSPDGQTLATASSDQTVKLWNRLGEELQTLQGHNDAVYSVAFSPDGETVATASWDNTVKLWNRQGKELTTLLGHSDVVRSVVFSPIGEIFATASADQTVKLWNRQGEELEVFQGHNSFVNSVSFSPDGETIATASADQTVKLWKRQGEGLTILLDYGDGVMSDGVMSVAFSPDGETIATINENQPVKLWNRQGDELQTLHGHSGVVRSVVFSLDGEMIATASADQTAKLWNRQGEELQTLQGHSASINEVAFSPDGETIATASADQTVKLWNRQGEELQTLQSHNSFINSVAFSPDGETIATASADQTVKLWNRQGEELQTLQGHSAPINSVTFSSDGEIIATASADQTAKLWNRQGEELQTLQGHSSFVNSVTFSPDGEIIATASADQTAKLWNRQGEELQTLHGHTATVSKVAFSPDGETLATASGDSTVKLWNFQLEDLIARGCNWLDTYLVKQSPELLMDLAVCQQQNPALMIEAAPMLVQRGEELAREGKDQQAIELFQQAINWNDSFDFDPRQKARDVSTAQALVVEGETLAKDGDLGSAAQKLAEAKELDASLDFEPESRAKEVAVNYLINEGSRLINSGDIDGAVRAYQKADAFGMEGGIVTHCDWNQLVLGWQHLQPGRKSDVRLRQGRCPGSR